MSNRWMVHAKNQTKIRGGQITLYQRDDLKGPTWHVRVRIEGHKGYVRRATGETDLAEATDKALTIFGELNERKTQAIPLKKKNFAEIADSFERRENPVEDAEPAPADETIVERLWRPLGCGRVAPHQAAPDHVDDPGDHPPVVHPRHPAGLVRQKRLQAGKLRIGKPEVVVRHPILSTSGILTHISDQEGTLFVDPEPNNNEVMEAVLVGCRCYAITVGGEFRGDI